MYRQIAEDLREQIESGRIAPGDQIPTEIVLRERYRASRNTVRDAVKWLSNPGLVETRPGQGIFIPTKIDPFRTTLTADTKRAAGQEVLAGEGIGYQTEVEVQNRAPRNTTPRVELQRANAAVAAQLLITEGDQVISRHQRRYIDDTPWSLQTSWYPRTLADNGAVQLTYADDIEEGAVKYLIETLGLTQVGYRDLITVRAPDTREASFVNLPSDGRVAVFEISRVAFDQEGKPMRLTVTVFPADRNQFIVNVGDVPQAGGG